MHKERSHTIPLIIFIFITVGALVLPLLGQGTEKPAPGPMMEKINLPEPRLTGSQSIDEALLKRRSISEYRNAPISSENLSQVLWAGQGITERRGLRTAPSAGALYPLEIYVVAGKVTGIPAGIYQYRSHTNELVRIVAGDRREDLSKTARNQRCVRTAAAVVVISAVYERTTASYGERGVRYAHMEAGHAAQNISLQAVALNLGCLLIGAFHDSEVKKIMQMQDREEPLYIIPVGKI